MGSMEDKAFRCVLSGEMVTTLGSRKEAENGKVDGISTDIGIISRKVIARYYEILGQSKRSKDHYAPNRKKMITLIDGTPSRREHQIAFESGKAGIPPYPPEEYFRLSQFPKKVKDPSV